MAQRQGTSWLHLAGMLAAALTIGPNTVLADPHGNHGHHDHGGPNPSYRGSGTLFLVSAGPNPAQCGNGPIVELVFEGEGIDTAGGITSIEASACQNVATGEVFDLVAIDTYLDGSTVTIVSDSFFFELDPDTCVQANTHSVGFDIGGGTGAYAGATGHGKYEIAFNDPSCNGELSPSYVWFSGILH